MRSVREVPAVPSLVVAELLRACSSRVRLELELIIMAGLETALQWLKRRRISVLCLAFIFIMSGLIVNALQLTTVPLYFINKQWFRKINSRLVYFHWCIVPWTVESWANYKIKLYTDSDIHIHGNTEHAIMILNHPGDIDWMIGWSVLDRAGVLGGIKAIMKDVALFLPGIGWSFLFMEYPLLKRDWKHDEAALIQSCKNLQDYPVNMLLCLFAEGTRFTEEKHKRSMEYARSRGLPELKHHLFPRTKGFCLLMKHLREAVPAIYDITICCPDRVPTLVDILNAKPTTADIVGRRYLTADIPDTDEGMADWLIKLYQDKDRLVDYYKKHKKFPDKYVECPLYRRVWPQVVAMVWFSFLAIPVFLTALYLAWVGAWLPLGATVTVIFVVDQIFQYLASHTSTKTNYGLSPGANNGAATPTTKATPITETTPTADRVQEKKEQ